MAARKAGRTYSQLIGEIVDLALGALRRLHKECTQPVPSATTFSASQPARAIAPTLLTGLSPQTRLKSCEKCPVSGGFSSPRRRFIAYTYRDCSSRAHLPYSPYLSGGHVTFQVGDKVIYPNHGLGVVQGIETKTILGTTCGFYHLRMVANETTVLVPVDNVDGVGLRRAISDEEIERLFSLLGDGKIDNHQNWKGRFKDNSDRMRTGSIYDVVEVLKSLTFLARSKNLSFREKRMLDRAKFLVISEISEVVARESPRPSKRKSTTRSSVASPMKTRSIARAKAAKAAPDDARARSRRTAKAS